MSFGAIITGRALPDLVRYMEAAPERATESARIALNTVADGSGMKLLRREIEDDVAFPAGYLDRDKLYVSQKARDANLEVVITAAQRPTSLARFVQGDKTPNKKGGVRVKVRQGGRTANMESAFIVRLKRGASFGADNFNLGLAIRLKEGERVINKKEQSAVQLTHNVYLLYGPSVDQVFRTAAYTTAGAFLELTEAEFLRQFVRLSNKA